MKKVRFNSKKFIKFLLVVSLFAFGVVAENGNITGALVLAMLM